MKIVINTRHGGFSVSRMALHRLRALGDPTALREVDVGEFYEDGSKSTSTYESYCRDIPRDSPRLLQTLIELGEAANGESAKLKVVEVPDGIDWEIAEYDGKEWVAEKHRTWG